MFIHYYFLKKATFWSPFLFLSFANQETSPHRSLGTIAFGRRFAALSGWFSARLGGACAGRGFALVGRFAGRFTLSCTLGDGLAVPLPQLQLGAHRFAIALAALVGSRGVALACPLVARAIAALMADVAVASQGRFHPFT